MDTDKKINIVDCGDTVPTIECDGQYEASFEALSSEYAELLNIEQDLG